MHRKTPEEREAIRAALRLNILFDRISVEQLDVMIGAMQLREFAPATEVIRQGDTDGDAFYVVESGTCDIVIAGTGRVMQVIGGHARNYFGELALLYDAPRAATVVTVGDVRCWALDRTTFKSVMIDTETGRQRAQDAFLQQVPVLVGLSPIERLRVADALKRAEVATRQPVVREGRPGNLFYVIERGEMRVTKQAAGGAQVEVSRRLQRGDYFGELALLHEEVRQATVTATMPSVVWHLDRRTFKRLLGPLEFLLKQNAELYDEFVAAGV